MVAPGVALVRADRELLNVASSSIVLAGSVRSSSR
jgi:hypothetical protein